MKEMKKGHRIDTTTKLRETIETALAFLPENKEKKDIVKKSCQRVFQALRIDVTANLRCWINSYTVSRMCWRPMAELQY